MSGTDIICTRWFHSSSGTSSQNAFRTPSSFATSLNTCQMSSCPLIPLKVFLLWNRQLCATTSPKVSPCSKQTDSTLPITASTFCLIFLFFYQEPNFDLITKKLTIQILQIARSRHGNLKKTCQHGQGGFQILAGFVFVEWSILVGFPESSFLKIISHLSILGDFLLHHF